jgi:holliday junction DNA helicase RuvA
VITAIEGILENKGTDSLTLKVGAISLAIIVPGSTLNQLASIGTSVKLHTHLHFREDTIALYGFVSRGELTVFQKLITVSGVGPRLACAILSTLNPEQIVSAIVGNNSDILSQSPGVGKKLAARIALELKGKIEKEWQGDLVSAILPGNADVITALTSLGYSIKEATQAVSSLPDSDELNIEDKIRMALQRLASK